MLIRRKDGSFEVVGDGERRKREEEKKTRTKTEWRERSGEGCIEIGNKPFDLFRL